MTSADAEIERHTLKGAADWHAAWAVGLGFCALAWPAADDLTLNFALGAAAAPGVIGQLARLPGRRLLRFLIALSWPLCIGAAIAMTGGLAGPLAALALMPAAAAATLSGGRYIAVGAALTAATVAAIALVTNAGLIHAPALQRPLAAAGDRALRRGGPGGGAAARPGAGRRDAGQGDPRDRRG